MMSRNIYFPAGYADVAKLLLDAATAAGIATLIDAADFKGRSALHLASAHQHDACVKLLLSCVCAILCYSAHFATETICFTDLNSNIGANL